MARAEKPINNYNHSHSSFALILFFRRYSQAGTLSEIFEYPTSITRDALLTIYINVGTTVFVQKHKQNVTWTYRAG